MGEKTDATQGSPAGWHQAIFVTSMSTSFEELTDSYSCIFFDAFGVLKSSAGVYPGVLDRVQELRERGKEIFVVTNDASKSPAQMAQGAYSNAAGEVIIEEERIITSGLLATEYLRSKVRSGYVAFLGKDASAYYIERAGLKPLHVAALVPEVHPKALVLLDDEGFDWSRDLNAALNLVRQHNMPVVVANTDITYPSKRNEVGIAIGGIAQLLQVALGHQFTQFGKPDPMIFNYAFERAKEKKPELTKRDILMVGDTLTTDIHGGNKFGVDTALVLSGVTLPHEAPALMRSKGIVPTYICDDILS